MRIEALEAYLLAVFHYRLLKAEKGRHPAEVSGQFNHFYDAPSVILQGVRKIEVRSLFLKNLILKGRKTGQIKYAKPMQTTTYFFNFKFSKLKWVIHFKIKEGIKKNEKK